MADTPPAPVKPLYPVRKGRCHLYRGPMTVAARNGALTVDGDLCLDLKPGPKLQAFLPPVGAVMVLGERPEIVIPPGSALSPPVGGQDIADGPVDPPQGPLRAGEIGDVERFLIHVIGELRVERQRATEEARPIKMDLPGWRIDLHPLAGADPEIGFTAMIDARPEKGADVGSWETLHRRLFVLLSFLCGREVGIGPTSGIDADENVVWTEWGDVRVSRGKNPLPWCPPTLVPEVLPQLATRFAALAEDEFLFAMLDRAIGFLLAADGEGVMVDVKVPMACSGLEAIAWATLQREELVVDASSMNRLTTAARLRLFLVWAGIPIALPGELAHLGKLSSSRRQDWWAGPELIVELRNQLVHPPRQIADPSWPHPEAIVDGWFLASWYLTLAILRLLGYEGAYWSRLPPPAPAAAHKLVPWAESADGTAD